MVSRVVFVSVAFSSCRGGGTRRGFSRKFQSLASTGLGDVSGEMIENRSGDCCREEVTVIEEAPGPGRLYMMNISWGSGLCFSKT